MDAGVEPWPNRRPWWSSAEAPRVYHQTINYPHSARGCRDIMQSIYKASPPRHTYKHQSLAVMFLQRTRWTRTRTRANLLVEMVKEILQQTPWTFSASTPKAQQQARAIKAGTVLNEKATARRATMLARARRVTRRSMDLMAGVWAVQFVVAWMDIGRATAPSALRQTGGHPEGIPGRQAEIEAEG